MIGYLLITIFLHIVEIIDIIDTPKKRIAPKGLKLQIAVIIQYTAPNEVTVAVNCDTRRTGIKGENVVKTTNWIMSPRQEITSIRSGW